VVHARRGEVRVCCRTGANGCRHGGGFLVLVLTRRANQSIMIGHEIVVTVLEVRGDQVRLGIKAPRSIDVHREEIFAQLQQANRDAAQAPKQQLESLEGFTKSSEGDNEAQANS
jgi:carbon storage regulator